MMMLMALLLSLQEATEPPTGPCALPEVTKSGTADASACETAIAAADHAAKAQLLFYRGYAWNEKGDSFAALADLDKAVAFDPNNVAARQERAYTNNELGNYAEALADLDASAALGIATKRLFQERALSRMKLGDITGAIADRDRVLALAPEDGVALNARADDLLFAGRFADARADIARAEARAAATDDKQVQDTSSRLRKRLALMTEGAEANPDRVCRDAQKNTEFKRTHLVATCTAAYLAAPGNPARAEMLTTRSVAWLFADDEADAVFDLQMAAALDPGNADWHANLGFSYVKAHHSWAGEREFDRSLAIKESWAALGGRAWARFNLRKIDGAFADAKRSFEIHPNEIALTVLGDLAADRKDPKAAKLYWMSAWHLGDHGDDLLERLKSIGVTDPAHEPATK
jgi:tetratricopeptide (TPR) repeat protein